jgi:hypothetical protein
LQRLCGLPMSLDVEKYRPFLAEYNLSRQEETKLIQTLWTILESFVDHAYGINPVQQCGRALEHNDLQSPIESLESAQHHPLKNEEPH